MSAISGMNISMNNNNRRVTRKAFSNFTGKSDKESMGIKIKPVSEEVLERIRKKMKKQKRNNKKRNLFIGLLSIMVSILFFCILIVYFKNDPGVSWGPFSVLTK